MNDATSNTCVKEQYHQSTMIAWQIYLASLLLIVRMSKLTHQFVEELSMHIFSFYETAKAEGHTRNSM